MSRARLAALAVVTGLGLVSGCCSCSYRPLFGPRPRECAPTCAGCEAGLPIEAGVPVEQGPILDGYVPPGVPAGVPVVPGPITAPGAVPQVPQPLTAPPDRLVPTPAQPEPYQPSGRGFQHGV